MKTISILLLLIGFVSHLVIAEETKPDYGFKNVEDLRANEYEFKFIKAEADQNHWHMGHFKFRWNGKDPIRLWGYGFEKDGSFRVRFENVSKMVKGQWREVSVMGCGTGKEMFTLDPNKDYILQVPLWPYEKDGEKGVVKINGDKISFLSDPFDVSSLKSHR